MPTSSSVFAGLRFSYALPERDSTHSPLIKFLKTLGATAVAILPPGVSRSRLIGTRVGAEQQREPPFYRHKNVTVASQQRQIGIRSQARILESFLSEHEPETAQRKDFA